MNVTQVIGSMFVMGGFLLILLLPPIGPTKWLVVVGLFVVGHVVLLVERFWRKRALSLQRGSGPEDLVILGAGASAIHSTAGDTCHATDASVGSGSDCGDVGGSI